MYAATFKSITGEQVTAFQLTELNLAEVAAWVDGEVVQFSQELLSGKFNYRGVRIVTHNGPQYARPGDWIVKDEKKVYPNKVVPSNQFAHLYSYV